MSFQLTLLPNGYIDFFEKLDYFSFQQLPWFVMSDDASTAFLAIIC